MNDFDRKVADIEAIKILKARYCRFLDHQMWDDFAELFTADCTFEADVRDPAQWSVFRKEGSSRAPLPLNTWIAMVKATMADGGVSIHHVHAPEISFADDDDAVGIWAVEDHLLTKAMRFRGWGHYEHNLIRGETDWKIARWRLNWLHIERI